MFLENGKTIQLAPGDVVQYDLARRFYRVQRGDSHLHILQDGNVGDAYALNIGTLFENVAIEMGMSMAHAAGCDGNVIATGTHVHVELVAPKTP